MLFIEGGWEARFARFQGPKWSRAQTLGALGPELLAAFHRLAAAVLSSMHAQGVHVKAPPVLAAVQVTAMHAQSLRGAHFDSPEQGDLVVSLTFNGKGTVFLGACATEPLGFTHEQSGTWYACSG